MMPFWESANSLTTCALLVIAVTASPAHAQSDSALNALNRRVIELHGAGKYGEAIPLAELYVVAARHRYGEDHTAYATSLAWLAQLLQATNRLAEAEPLTRRALTRPEDAGCPRSRLSNAIEYTT